MQEKRELSSDALGVSLHHLIDYARPLKYPRSGVSVPGIRMVDAAEGVLGIEWIEGKSVRMLLGGGAEGEEEQVWDPDQFFDDATDDSVGSMSHVDPLEEYQITMGTLLTYILLLSVDLPCVDEIMRSIGSEIAKMHKADIIHGDLTTSNMIIRHPFAAKGPSPTKLVRSMPTHSYSPWSTKR